MFRSAKYRDIVEDPVIRYKPVESLPGIGPVHGRRLRDNGFYTADQVLAQYLALKRNEQRFVSWMTMGSGVSAHWAALCFNGLNDWYNTWGRDVKIAPRPLTSPTERGSITNRMLLEQKMLQFNSNSNEDRLRCLFSNQTISLVDISKSSERPKLTLDRLNKSNFNIAENTHSYTDQERSNNLKKLPSPTSKSVNFKENVEFNAQLPKKTPLSGASKRPISPILKSRSLTPDLSQSSKKSLNISTKILNGKNEARSKGSSMNNLNSMAGVNKKVSSKAKSIENICGSNTFTRTKCKTSTSKKFNLKKPEKLVCTCNYPYQDVELWPKAETLISSKAQTSTAKKLNLEKSEELVCTCNYPYGDGEVWTSSETDSTSAPQNIKKYFVEKQNEVGDYNLRASNHSTPFKLNRTDNKHESQCEDNCSSEVFSKNKFRNSKISKSQIEEIENERRNEKQNGTLEQDCSNHDYDSVISSDDVFTANGQMQGDNAKNVTVDSRDLENVELENQKNEICTMELIEEVNYFQSEESANVNDALSTEKKTTNQALYERNSFDYSNEDSGLDVTPKSNVDFQEYAGETLTTDDECSTPFENLDSRSQSDTDTETDRTFEVNDTTDAESGFHFVSTNSESNLNYNLNTIEENIKTESKGTAENTIDHSSQSLMDDELKRSNIRLFCNMLSNDLEQLPMEKFRKLKLKILKLVYEEIDQSSEN